MEIGDGDDWDGDAFGTMMMKMMMREMMMMIARPQRVGFFDPE